MTNFESDELRQKNDAQLFTSFRGNMDEASNALDSAYAPILGNEANNYDYLGEWADLMDEISEPQSDVSVNETTVMPVVEVTPSSDELADARYDRLGKRRAKTLLYAGAACVVAVAALVSVNGDPDSKGREQTPMTAPNDGSNIAPNQAKNFRDGLSSVFVGFQEGDLAVGNQVNFNANPEERGDNSFVRQTLKSRENIKEYLASDDSAAKATVASLNETFSDDPVRLERALNGEAFVPVQVHKDAVVKGNTYYKNGKAYFSDHARKVKSGDVFWFYVNEDGTVVPDASIRADCANIKLVIVVPQKEIPRDSTTTTEADERTTTTGRGSTTTTRPGSTTTTGPGTTSTTRPTGPKQNPKPPAQGGSSTTVPAPQPGPSRPTTSTTSRSTSSTNPPSTVPNTTPTSSPPTTQPPRP